MFDQFVANADYLIDLHSGGVEYLFQPLVGFYGEPEPDNASFQAGRSFGLENLWQLPATRGVLSHEAWKQGIVAIGAEYLGAGQLAPSGRHRYVEGILSCLALWGLVPGGPSREPSGSVYEGDWLLAEDTGLFEAACGLGQDVRRGEHLAVIIDLRGERQQAFAAPHDGVVLGLRSKTYIRKGDWAVLLGLQRSDHGRGLA